MIISCQAGYNIVETTLIIVASLWAIGASAGIVIFHLMNLITKGLDKIIPPPLQEDTVSKYGLTPVDRSAWPDTPSGGVAEDYPYSWDEEEYKDLDHE